MAGCPFVHTVHFPSSAFAWTYTKATDGTATESKEPAVYSLPAKPWKKRYRCSLCGVAVAGYSERTGNWSVWASQLDQKNEEDVKKIIKPTAHIFYGTRMLDVEDGIGKWDGYEGSSTKLELR